MAAPDFSTKQVVSIYYKRGTAEEVVSLVKPRFETIGNRVFLVGVKWVIPQLQGNVQGREIGVAWDSVLKFDCE